MNRQFHLSVISLCVLMFLVNPSAFAQSGSNPVQGLGYTVQYLGHLGGGYTICANVGNTGAAVGYSRTAYGYDRAFLWRSGRMTDLGALPGGVASYATNINDSEQVVGWAGTSAGAAHAFLWDSVNGMRDLGTLGGLNSYARGINNIGRVVGEAQNSAGRSRAFLWSSANGMRDLGTLGGQNSYASGINGLGQVVGAAQNARGEWRAFVWEDKNANGVSDSGEMTDLGALPYAASSYARAINNGGQIVGGAQFNTFGALSEYALRWDSPTATTEASFGGAKSIGYNLNAEGLMVGAGLAAGGDWRAFRMDDAYGTLDLNNYILPGSGWILRHPQGINDQGQIAGFGDINGRILSYLLTPLKLLSLKVAPTSIGGGTTVTGTLTLNGKALSLGHPLSLTSSNPAVLVPTSVTIPAGANKATFSIRTLSVTSARTVTITATDPLQGSAVSAPLTVQPFGLSSLSFSLAKLKGGRSTVGTVTLNGAAPDGGVVVSLSSASAKFPVPASVTIPAGAMSRTFTTTTLSVSAPTNAMVTAKYLGVTKSVTATVNPASYPSLSRLSLGSASLVGGKSLNVTVTLTGTVPAGGLDVFLTSPNNKDSLGLPVFSGLPRAITVPAGQSSATVTLNSNVPVSPSTITLNAGDGGANVAQNVAVNTLSVSSLDFPISVKGGKQATIKVKINGVAPAGGTTVYLHSDRPCAYFEPAPGVVSPDISVVVPEGQSEVEVTVYTTEVEVAASPAISASADPDPVRNAQKVNNLTVIP